MMIELGIWGDGQVNIEFVNVIMEFVGLMVNVNMSDDVVYNLVKVFWEI